MKQVSDSGVGVARGERAQVVVDLALAHPGGQVERPVEADLGGQLLEKGVHARGADLGEHRLAVGIRG